MIVQVVLAFVAAAAADLVILSVGQSRQHLQGRADATALCVFVLVLAAERGWYS